MDRDGYEDGALSNKEPAVGRRGYLLFRMKISHRQQRRQGTTRASDKMMSSTEAQDVRGLSLECADCADPLIG